jgi:hypothetical protein
MPHKLKDPIRHKFKKKSYNVRDWKAYDQGLQNRGNLTIWFAEDAINAWNASRPERMKRGRPCLYSDLAIETSHILRLVYKQPLRQTEGFIKSIVTLLHLDLIVPDHTTLSRRARKISIAKNPNIFKEKLVVIVDGTGLKVFGEREWMNTKHGTKQRKVWRKLNIAIDDEGEILSSTLTTHEVSDVSQVPDLLEEIEVPIDEFIGDAGGYDHAKTYETLLHHEQKTGQEHSISAVIPPNIGFKPKHENDSAQRKKNIDHLHAVGRQKWQKDTRYGRRSGVENTIYRYKTIIGRTLRSQDTANQNTEVKIGVNILNRMKALGMPKARSVA